MAAMDYRAEIRFGVVMYGGVSLAIYINGVTNEMYELARATPRNLDGGAPARHRLYPAPLLIPYRFRLFF